MSNIQKVAAAFAAGKPAQCHNARTDGREYHLHGNRIAHHVIGATEFDWCNWFTPTTANHLRHIARELSGRPQAFSYAQARDGKVPAAGAF